MSTKLLPYFTVCIDIKFVYPNNPDGWQLSGMWGKHVCVVGIQLQGKECNNYMESVQKSQKCQNFKCQYLPSKNS